MKIGGITWEGKKTLQYLVVARASGNVIGEYLHAFKTIEYAIYCSPRDEKNYETFKRVLKL